MLKNCLIRLLRNKIGIVVSCLILTLILSFKIFHLNKNPTFLNIFSRCIFDEQYYVNNYPEVRKSDLSPFQHYTQIGWKERKNPSIWFDTSLYMRMHPDYGRYNLNPLQHYIQTFTSFKPTQTHSSQLKKVIPLKNPTYYLALVAIFRDEAPYLKEWIEFYRLMGVEHFYLYNHLSTDHFQEVLQPYIDKGIVDLYTLTETAKNLKHWNEIQVNAYMMLIQKVRYDVEWLAIVDTDEFMFPIKETSLSKILKNYDNYATLSVNWRIFGSGDVYKIPKGDLLTESLVMASTHSDLHVKSIVKPRYVKSIRNPHFAILENGYAQVNENREYFKGPFLPKETRSILRVNHYWSRDWSFFNSIKINRIHVSGSTFSKAEKDKKIKDLIHQNRMLSQEKDTSIFRFIPELKKRLSMSDPIP